MGLMDSNQGGALTLLLLAAGYYGQLWAFGTPQDDLVSARSADGALGRAAPSKHKREMQVGSPPPPALADQADTGVSGRPADAALGLVLPEQSNGLQASSPPAIALVVGAPPDPASMSERARRP